MVNRNQAPPITRFENVSIDVPAPIRLNNGIETWIVGDGDDDICRIAIYVVGGIAHDTKPLLSSIVSSAIFEGTERLSASEIAEVFDYYGATKQICPYDECCELTIVALNENLERVLTTLLQCITQPTFAANEVAVIQQRLQSNISILRQRVKFLAQTEVNKLYYGNNHPLAPNYTPEDILTVTVDDIRDFHRHYYHPANCRLIVSGKVTDKEIDVLNRTIGSWIDPTPPSPQWQWFKQPTTEITRVIDKPDTVQAALHMMMPTGILRSHHDYPKLRLLITAFGAYFGSRLMQNIREEKGYTYGIYASLSGRRYDSHINIMTECDCKYVKPTLTEIEREIDRLHNEPIPDDELEKVRQYALSEQVKTLDTAFSRGQYVASMLLYDIDDQYFSRMIDAIQNTSALELQCLAKKYLKFENFKCAIVGDANKI